MAKQILIIGGGLSGLTVLHALRARFADQPEVRILLLEKEDRPGGTIRTEQRGGRLFEWGPNGFLNSRPATLALMDELGLSPELVRADPQAAERFIAVGNALHALPTGPSGLWRFAPMRLREKLRILREPLVPRGTGTEESVYDFGTRRLGEAFARVFLDPMVSGVFAGDARRLSLKSAFPRIHEIEQTYGSLIRGMIRLKRRRQGAAKAGQPAGDLTSLRGGMGQWIEALAARHAACLRCGEPVQFIRRGEGGYVVESSRAQYLADAVIVCAPAYAAADMVTPLDGDLAVILRSVEYAPLAVVGLVYPRSGFPRPPRGFGYLIPSEEKRKALGVLFDSNIFPGRSGAQDILLRVMLGGARHPDLLQNTDDDLAALAQDEVRSALGAVENPEACFLSRWPRAIPQYQLGYAGVEQRLAARLQAFPGLKLCANYLGGISMNDCVVSAGKIADSVGFYE